MRELDEMIAKWRSSLQLDSEALDELESHLRDEVQRLIAGGVNEAMAFEVAVVKLGTKEVIAAEYGKVERTPRVVKVALGTWVAVMIVATAFLSLRVMSGRVTGLLFTHIFTLLAGYLGAFALTAMGIAMTSGTRGVRGWVVAFTPVVAALIGVAIWLGMVWAKLNYGHSAPFNPRELGAMAAFAWYVAATCMHGWQLRDETVARMTIGGGVVVVLVWFGAGLAPAVPPLVRVLAAAVVFILTPLWMMWTRRKNRAGVA